MSTPVPIITDERMIEHDPGPGHPERPERLAALIDAVRALPPGAADVRAPRAATAAEVERVHPADYVRSIERLRGRSAALDPDTIVSPASVEAAFLAAGAALTAAESAIQGTPAFALVRPPGHHAEPARAMGFCLFGNVAVAAAHARAALGAERVMIVDFDVHHGNGTQAIFEARHDVLVFSSHEFPQYPGTGAADEIGTGAGRGYTVNAPIPFGAGDATMLAVHRALVPALAERFRPDVILVSAGFDADARDPLAGLRMTSAGFGALCALLLDTAARFADGRLALVLEGGYDLDALRGGVTACIDVLGGAPAPDTDDATATDDETAARVLAAIRRAHGPAAPLM